MNHSVELPQIVNDLNTRNSLRSSISSDSTKPTGVFVAKLWEIIIEQLSKPAWLLLKSNAEIFIYIRRRYIAAEKGL